MSHLAWYQTPDLYHHMASINHNELTHWGRVTHICVNELTIIGSDNGLPPGRRQAIIWNNTGLLLIEPLGTNFSEISIGIQTFSFKKMHLNMSSAKWRPFCLGLNLLKPIFIVRTHFPRPSQIWCHDLHLLPIQSGSTESLGPALDEVEDPRRDWFLP